MSQIDENDLQSDHSDGEHSKNNDSDFLTSEDEQHGRITLSQLLDRSSLEAKMVLSTKYKSRGNYMLTETCEYDRAIKYYKRAIRILESLPKDSTLELYRDSNAMKQSVNLNLSLAFIKTESWFQAIEAAGNVLKECPTNQKALFRRGLSRCRYGFFSEAYADLQELLRFDPNNVEAKRELLVLRGKVEASKQSNRKAFSGIFKSSNVSLYADREKERENILKKEEEERKNRRAQWHKEMDVLKANGDDEIPFEEWNEAEERKIKEKKEQENQERIEKQKRHADDIFGPRASKHSELPRTQPTDVSSPPLTTSSTSVQLSDEGLDDEDQKILDETKKMGYCYFRRNLTDEEKNANAQNRPHKLDEAASAVEEPKKAISSWNSKGTTYEERDTSQWCIENFSKKLRSSSASFTPDFYQDPMKLCNLFREILPMNGAGEDLSRKDPTNLFMTMAQNMFKSSLQCTGVTDVGGEGHISVLRGTKRYLFDLHATLQWVLTLDMTMQGVVPPGFPSLKNSQADTIFTYEGQLIINDVSSAMSSDTDWLADSVLKYTSTKPPKEHSAACDKIIEAFKENVKQNLTGFLEDYRAAF